MQADTRIAVAGELGRKQPVGDFTGGRMTLSPRDPLLHTHAFTDKPPRSRSSVSLRLQRPHRCRMLAGAPRRTCARRSSVEHRRDRPQPGGELPVAAALGSAVCRETDQAKAMGMQRRRTAAINGSPASGGYAGSKATTAGLQTLP